MDYIVYMTTSDLINQFIINSDNLYYNFNIYKMNIYVDSILSNIPLHDIIIDKDYKNIIKGLDVISCLYFFIYKNKRLNGDLNELWKNKKFEDLNNNLKNKLLAYMFRTIQVEHPFIKYYEIY